MVNVKGGFSDTKRTFIAFLAMLGVAFLFPFLGRIEGFLFPVTDSIVFTEVNAAPEGVRVAGHYQKLRDCHFLGAKFLRWNGYELDRDRIGEPPVHTPDGHLPAGPILLETSIKTLRKGLTVVGRHRCHPLWVTVTVNKAKLNLPPKQ